MLIGFAQQRDKLLLIAHATVGMGLCSFRLRQQRRQKVRFIKMLGEFLRSYRFSSQYAVPEPLRGGQEQSPFPTVTSQKAAIISIHGSLGTGEQGGDPVSQGAGLGSILGAPVLNPLGGGLLGLLQNLQIKAHVRHAEGGQA